MQIADRLREQIRLKKNSARTEKVYIGWYEKFIQFHKVKHPTDMGEPEIEQFLTHLAVERKVSSSTRNQALSTILFL